MRLLLLSLLLLTPFAAAAEIYECVDPSGNKRFTNVRAEAKGCKLLDIGPFNTVPAPKPQARNAPGPANFPRVDADTQRQRDGDRRRILEQELANEERQLVAAQRELAEQQAVRASGEPTQRALDRLEPYQKKVKLHQDNVESLKRELANVR